MLGDPPAGYYHHVASIIPDQFDVYVAPKDSNKHSFGEVPYGSRLVGIARQPPERKL